MSGRIYTGAEALALAAAADDRYLCDDGREALHDAAPDLAASVAHHDARALRAEAERDAMRAIIEGRATPPTLNERIEHEARGGAWVITTPERVLEGPRGRTRTPARTILAETVDGAGHFVWSDGARWVAVRDGRPCAWPEVTP